MKRLTQNGRRTVVRSFKLWRRPYRKITTWAALAANDLLKADWDIGSEVYSVTSFSDLARDTAETQRWNRLHPKQQPRRHHIAQQLSEAPLTVAATDYVRAYPQLIASHVNSTYVTLGTDGFGRSDTRPSLRRFFEVDRRSIVIAALEGLSREGLLPAQTVAQAIERYGVSTDDAAPWTR